MYIPTRHQLTDRDEIFKLIADHPFGAWIFTSEDGLTANHIPFFLDRSRGPLGTLMAHVARANPIWRELRDGVPSMVLFQGPHAYISPGWYPSKAKHGKVVPTWNYAVAHVHGVARAVDDTNWLMDMLNRLTDANEARQNMPWRVADAPVDYIEKLSRAIVGIEIPIDRLEAKMKASQTSEVADRFGAIDGLRRTPSRTSSDTTAAMADLMRRVIDAEISEQ